MPRENLGAIRNLLAATRSRFIATADSFPSNRWRDLPSAGTWSAAEIVAHTMQVEVAVLMHAKKTLRKPPYPVPFIKRFHLPLFLAAGRSRKIRSPIPIDPLRVPDQSEYKAKIAANREATVAFIEDTTSQDLSPYTFPHPVFGPLNLYGWLRLIAYHELRHAKQIREVAEIFHR
jgi:hypothetical protein